MGEVLRLGLMLFHLAAPTPYLLSPPSVEHFDNYFNFVLKKTGAIKDSLQEILHPSMPFCTHIHINEKFTSN